MKVIRAAWSMLWRSVVVGVGYFVALMLGGVIAGALGVLGSGQGSSTPLGWVIVASVAIGLFLGPLAARLSASRGQQALIWASVIFFNMGSVAIEGALFAPALVPVPAPVLAAQQVLGALSAGGLIAVLFAPRAAGQGWGAALRQRGWVAWAWRFVLSALSYVLFYWVFGALNYSLVTGPYYAAHAGGLMVPAPAVVLAAELARAPLLVASVWLFVLSLTYRTSRRRAMLLTGAMLFWIGGVVPLLMQAGSLPWLLLAASAVEIFCQNFLTGAVAAALLRPPELREPASVPSAAPDLTASTPPVMPV